MQKLESERDCEVFSIVQYSTGHFIQRVGENSRLEIQTENVTWFTYQHKKYHSKKI